MGLGGRADSYSFKKTFTRGNPFFYFFIGMLLAYYGYTVLFLNFFPKSQIILWGVIAMVTPFCGFLIWHIRKKSHYANLISSLPFTIFFTEWYLAAFTVRDWDFSLLYGLLISIILILLIQAEIIVNPYEQLLNI